MNFRFKLIDGAITTLVDEPVGWADIDLVLKRDPVWHGIFFEYGSKTLTFNGTGADIIRNAYFEDGLAADVQLTVEAYCNNEWVELIKGRLNFGRLRYNCDEGCTAQIPVEQDTCMMKLRARWDTPIDLESLTAIDGAAMLAYVELKRPVDIPPGGVVLVNDGDVAIGGDLMTGAPAPHVGSPIGGLEVLSIRPWYDRVTEQSLLGQLSNPVSEWVFGDSPANPLSPQALIENETHCFSLPISYSARHKGYFKITNNAGSTLTYTWGMGVYTGAWGPSPDRLLINSTVLPPLANIPGHTSVTVPFDITLSGTFNPVDIPYSPDFNKAFWAVIEIALSWGSANFDVEYFFDQETNVLVEAVETCEPSKSSVYLTHETLSRLVESATNNCMKVRSEYYSRYNSEPFTFGYDTCAGLRGITNGQYLRQSPEATMKITPKLAFEGLTAIDNIGMSVEEFIGETVLRVEDFQYFYQDSELFYLDHVSGLVKEVIESMHWNSIFIGYKKWDTQTISCGRNEWNSERLYTTKFNQTKNKIEILSDFIAGYYMIEQARRGAVIKVDGESGSTQHDSNFFIFVLTRDAGAYVVEQGNIASVANIKAPTLAINYQLTPTRNLMRWWRVLAAGFRDITALDSSFTFTDGKGNLSATAIIDPPGPCVVETHPIQENESIEYDDMYPYLGFPIWTPEKISFEYPFDVGQYLKLKNNPNGYFRYQCGNGNDEKGWLTELRFNPSEGKGIFTLIAKR